MLDLYVRQFDTVEINNSFYRLPTEEAFQAWRDSTPADFLFAVRRAASSRTIRNSRKRIEGRLDKLKHAYIYFDNDQEAYAARNALDLKRLLG
jgi:uncharacterized protein YecE (DUF72 family)